jgi:hypothetical protein
MRAGKIGNRVMRCRAFVGALGLIVGTTACASVDTSSPSVRPSSGPQSSAPSTSQASTSSVATVVPVETTVPIETTGPPTSAASRSTTTAPATPRSTVPYPTTTIDENGPAYVGPLTFKWPTGCTVKVARTTKLASSAMETVHEYDLTLSEEAGNLVVSYGFPMIVAMDGFTTAFEMKKGTVGGPIDFSLTPDGHLYDIVHSDAWLASYSRVPKSDPKRLVADATTEVQTNYWLLPIGMWLQFDGTAPPEPRTGSASPPLNSTFKQRLESLPIGPPGRARLQMQASHIIVAADSLPPIPTQAPDATTSALPSMIGRTTVITFEAVLDPMTMRPDVASMHYEFSPPSEGTDDFSKSESYAFDWKNSNCS